MKVRELKDDEKLDDYSSFSSKPEYLNQQSSFNSSPQLISFPNSNHSPLINANQQLSSSISQNNSYYSNQPIQGLPKVPIQSQQSPQQQPQPQPQHQPQHQYRAPSQGQFIQYPQHYPSTSSLNRIPEINSEYNPNLYQFNSNPNLNQSTNIYQKPQYNPFYNPSQSQPQLPQSQLSQSQPQPQSQIINQDQRMAEMLESLKGMGFNNYDLNKRAIIESGYDLSKAVSTILNESNDN